MKVVYVAHPIGGDVAGNIKKIIEICRYINLTMQNVVPFVPYLSDLYALDDNDLDERERGLKNGLFLLTKGVVDEIWLFGDRISDGMEKEILTSWNNDIKVVPQTRGTKTDLQNIKAINITSNKLIYNKKK